MRREQQLNDRWRPDNILVPVIPDDTIGKSGKDCDLSNYRPRAESLVGVS